MSVELPSMSIERIREALAAGPTPGPWTVMPANAGEQCVARINAWESVPPNGVELAHDTIDAAFIAACHPAAIRELLAERDALKAENERLRAERDELRDVLLRAGFAPCDIPACNCGSWHHRYGLPERMRNIEDTLAEAGHELSNANGNLTLNALKGLVAERDELRRQLAEARAEREAMLNALETMLIGACAVGVPHAGERQVLQEAVDSARAVINAARKEQA